jgi:hypothetical protein
VANNLVRLVGNQDARCENSQVLGPPAAHRQSDAFRAFEQGVGDGADRKRACVREVADLCQQPEQELDDHVMAGVEVELVLCVIRPLSEQAAAAGDVTIWLTLTSWVGVGLKPG